ncbi:hypothetical protein ACFU44_30215 [Nocardia rhizosphaerihabitans]|uniref:hypothetical protein n=1 Tax=Nocardia rhizosphaerihabitans TaxID=1691570 RepID=UPI00366B89AC
MNTLADGTRATGAASALDLALQRLHSPEPEYYAAYSHVSGPRPAPATLHR